jgi:seryl-tRNA synthetase
VRQWLVSLIREAVRAEVEHHFRALEDKTARIETHFAQIAVQVREKQQRDAKERGKQEARERAFIARLEGIEGRLDAVLTAASDREADLEKRLLDAKNSQKPPRPRGWTEVQNRLESEG